MKNYSWKQTFKHKTGSLCNDKLLVSAALVKIILLNKYIKALLKYSL